MRILNLVSRNHNRDLSDDSEILVQYGEPLFEQPSVHDTVLNSDAQVRAIAHGIHMEALLQT